MNKIEIFLQQFLKSLNITNIKLISDRNNLPDTPNIPYIFYFLVSGSESTDNIDNHTSWFTFEYQINVVCKSSEYGMNVLNKLIENINNFENENVGMYVVDIVPSEPKDSAGLLQYALRINLKTDIY